MSPRDGLLRGMSSVNYWAADHDAATAWYTDLLGMEPYFRMPGATRSGGSATTATSSA